MKEHLLDVVRSCATPGHGVCVAREYVQARILGCLQRSGAMVPLAFLGGTALRFLFSAPRYSEDLDFSLEGDRTTYSFRTYLGVIRNDLLAEGYDVDLKVSDRKQVHSAFVRFRGLLHELGLSPLEGQVLAVKVEVDTDPPKGAGLTTTVVRRYVTLQIHHHDRASLLAGKIHALLDRPYLKGRDVHDLMWYLSDPGWPEPNMTLLQNALEQTGWTGPPVTTTNWRALARERLKSAPWERVVDDVRPFLEPGTALDLLTPANLMRLL